MLRFVLFLILIAPAIASATIFDNDDRVDVEPDGEFAPIGIVSGGERVVYGTGFLIDSCSVLTARHVAGVVDPVGRTMRFATQGGRSNGRVIASGSFHEPKALPRNLKDDWLLLRLDRCLGRKLGYFNLGPVLSAQSVQDAGFPRDRSTAKLSVDRMCIVHSIGRGELNHDCATLPGNSGGPILQRTPAGPLIAVGMNVAGNDRATSEKFMLSEANVAIEASALLPLVCPLLIMDENEGCRKTQKPEKATLDPLSLTQGSGAGRVQPVGLPRL